MTKNSNASPSKGYAPSKSVCVAIVGFSGPPSVKGNVGIGKSCLCNRFVRQAADDFCTQHISFLSQQDFFSPVINRSHSLYWGSVHKNCKLLNTSFGQYQFEIIEHTEFIDDRSFTAFKSAGDLNYEKRCSVLKLCSEQKLMYISKQQLGLEHDFHRVFLPQGGLKVDGFILCIDSSEVPNRCIESQVRFSNSLYNALSKTKRPIVVALTKFDSKNDLVTDAIKKSFLTKKNIMMFETSAIDNVNCNLPFFAVAMMVDKISRGVGQLTSKQKIFAYPEAKKQREKQLQDVGGSYLTLLLTKVIDYRSSWEHFLEVNQTEPIFMNYTRHLGISAARRQFNRHVTRLKEERTKKKLCTFYENLPKAFSIIYPRVNYVSNCWHDVVETMQNHEMFDKFFVRTKGDWISSILFDCDDDNRIPSDILKTPEAQLCFQYHCDNLQMTQRKSNEREQLADLLRQSPLVSASNMTVLSWSQLMPYFSDSSCLKSGLLSVEDCDNILQLVLKEQKQKLSLGLLELLCESLDVFVPIVNQLRNQPGSELAAGPQHLLLIEEHLKDDTRYMAMCGALMNERDLLICRYIHFLLSPSPAGCLFNLAGRCMHFLIPAQMKMVPKQYKKVLRTPKKVAKSLRDLKSSYSVHNLYEKDGPGGEGAGDRLVLSKVDVDIDEDTLKIASRRLASESSTHSLKGRRSISAFACNVQGNEMDDDDSAFTKSGKELNGIEGDANKGTTYENLGAFDSSLNSVSDYRFSNVYVDPTDAAPQIEPLGIACLMRNLSEDVKQRVVELNNKNNETNRFLRPYLVTCANGIAELTKNFSCNSFIFVFYDNQSLVFISDLLDSCSHLLINCFCLLLFISQFSPSPSRQVQPPGAAPAVGNSHNNLSVTVAEKNHWINYATSLARNFSRGSFLETSYHGLNISLLNIYAQLCAHKNSATSTNINGTMQKQLSLESPSSLTAELDEEDDDLHYHSTSIVNVPKFDLNILVCMLCGDQYNVLKVLSPLFSNPNCSQSNENEYSLIMESFFDLRKQLINIAVVAFHELGVVTKMLRFVHGMILVYSPNRKASVRNISFFNQIHQVNPRVPRLIVSIDSSSSNSSESSTLSQKPNAANFEMNQSVAQFHPANTRFLTVGPNFSSQTAIFAPFFQEAWKNKPDVEASERNPAADFSAADAGVGNNAGTAAPYQNMMFGSKASHRQHSREFSAPVLSTFSNKDCDEKETEQEAQTYSVCSYLASPVKSKKLTSQKQSTTEPFICYTKIRADNPLTIETQNLETCFSAASSSRQLRSLVSPLSRPSPRPYSMVDAGGLKMSSGGGGGSVGTVDQSLDGSKSKSGSVRSGGAESTTRNNHTPPSSAIHNSQGQLCSSSSRLTAGDGTSSKSKKSSTHSVTTGTSKEHEQMMEDGSALYDSIEAINTSSAVESSPPGAAAPSSSSLLGGEVKHGRDPVDHHRKQMSNMSRVQYDKNRDSSSPAGGSSQDGNDAMYSRVNRLHSNQNLPAVLQQPPLLCSASQPCSPLPSCSSINSQNCSSSGAYPRNSLTYASTGSASSHGKSRSEVIPNTLLGKFKQSGKLQYVPAPVIPPPVTQDRLIYERLDSSGSSDHNHRGSGGSLLDSGSAISNDVTAMRNNTTNGHTEVALSSSSSQDSRSLGAGGISRESQYVDDESHIYDEVAEENQSLALKISNMLSESEKISSATGPEGKLKKRSDSLGANPQAGNMNDAKKKGKLKKQKSFTKKWLSGSNKHNSSNSHGNMASGSTNSETGLPPCVSYFGQPLELMVLTSCENSNELPSPPLFVTQCIEYIEEHGLESEGIYRQPGNQSDRENLLAKFDKAVMECCGGGSSSNSSGNNSSSVVQISEEVLGHVIHKLALPVDSVASALKLFFSKLPQPLIPFAYHDSMMKAAINLKGNQPNSLLGKIETLPAHNYVTLRCLIRHLGRVSDKSDVNKMTSENLATCFWPTLLRPAYTSLDAMCGSYKCRYLIETLINYHTLLFPPQNRNSCTPEGVTSDSSFLLQSSSSTVGGKLPHASCQDLLPSSAVAGDTPSSSSPSYSQSNSNRST